MDWVEVGMWFVLGRLGLWFIRMVNMKGRVKNLVQVGAKFQVLSMHGWGQIFRTAQVSLRHLKIRARFSKVLCTQCAEMF